MKILVIYQSGDLGPKLLERLNSTSLNITPLLLSQPETVALDQLQSWLEPDFDLVVNAITMDDPEEAEVRPEYSRACLYDIPRALAERAAFHAIAMVQLSSCYVFDGRKHQPYIASNPGNPLSILGRDQWEAEQFIRATLPRHLILRTGWSLRRLIRKVAGHPPGESLHMSSRKVGQPVAVDDWVRVIVAVMQQLDCGAEAWGTYQYASSDPISLYELGLQIAATLAADERPNLIDEDADWLRIEPANAVLNCKKIRHTFGIQQRSWRDALAVNPEA